MEAILIVGAGPVGLTLAAELARFGLEVRLVDRSPHPTTTSKALVIWSRTLELMDRSGCTPAFLQAGLHARGASIRNGGAILGHMGFGDIASSYNFALMIPQSETERLLAAQLETLGITVERQVELVGFSESASAVDAVLSHADGRRETVRTPWLIGCDGAHSTVRHGLGFEFQGTAQRDDWVLADVRLEGRGKPAADEITTYLHQDGPLAMFPMPGGRTRVISTAGRATAPHPRPDPTLADVQALVGQRAGGGISVVDPAWLANFRISERKVSEYRRGRIFLAGDAAHVHSPAGGQGMNTGMQDAINLAWKLAMVERQEAAAILLDSYSPERNAVGEMVLRNASRLTDIGTLARPAAQAARDLALRFLLGLHAVQDRLAATMSEIEISYAESSLSAGPRAGARWAPEHYCGPPPGSGGAPRFILFAAEREAGAAFAARFPGLLEPEPRRPPDPKRLLVIRPDGYVGLSADSAGWREAEHYLQALAA